MATVGEIAKDLLGTVDSETGYLNACKWIDNRYKELVSKVRFRHLRKWGELSVPATYTTGTVAATRGSTALTGTDTEWETNIGSGTQQYWWIKLASAWYRIASVGGETSITLASAYAENDETAATYTALKRHHPLATDARWLGTFTHPRYNRTLRMRSAESMEDLAPGRLPATCDLRWWSEVGVDSDDTILVELFPLMSTSELVRYTYWAEPPTLTAASSIPQKIDPYVLKEGAYVDMCRFQMAMALKAGSADTAAVWRNEYQAGITRWNRIVASAIKTDKGADDVTLTVTTDFGPYPAHDITTAQDAIWSRGGWDG